MPGTQIQPYLAPRGGLNLSLPANLISELEMSDCRNVWFNKGLVKKRYGYSEFSLNIPLDSAIMESDQFFLFSGSESLLAITKRLVYKYNTTTKYWENIIESSVKDDCETNWTGSAPHTTCATDNADYMVGSKSVKISIGDTFTTGVAAYRDSSVGDVHTYANVTLWIKSSIALTAGQLQFLIDNTPACASPLETINIPALAANTWTQVVLTIVDPSALTAVASLGINTSADFGACNIWIDDVRFANALSTSFTDSDQINYASIRKSSEVNPWWIMTNGVDVIKKWTGTGNISNLIASYPSGVTALTAKVVREFKDYLLLMDVTEDGNRYPQRVRWSDTATPDDFDGGNASYIDLPGYDWIKTGLKFRGDYIVVLKSRSIWVGYATGDSTIFQFDQKVSGVGCMSAKTVQNLGDSIIFLGWEDIYLFDGINYEEIGGPIREELFQTLNPAQADRCLGAIFEDQKEYWLFVPSSTSTYCDVAWVYNYELKKWSRHELYNNVMNYGFYERQSSLTIGDLSGTIGEQTWRFGDRTILATSPTVILFDENGNSYEYNLLTNNDNGNAIDGWFSSKDFMFTGLAKRQRILRVDTYYKGTSLVLSYSVDKGITWTTFDTLTESTNYEVKRSFLRLDCDMVRFRFRNATAGEHFDFREARIYWQEGGLKI